MRRILFLFPLLSGALAAHDLYILPNLFWVNAGSRLQLAFHNGDSFPDSESAPALSRLMRPQLSSVQIATSITGLQTIEKRTVGFVDIPPSQGSLYLSVYTRPNLIELPAAKFLAYLKEEGLKQVIAWRSNHGDSAKPGRERYSKFAKSLVTSGQPDNFYAHPLGLLLEIVPQANPATMPLGKELPVQVMFRGRAAADLQVEAAWSADGQSKTIIVGRTDAQGRIRIPIKAAGKWRLHALSMEPCKELAVADWESSWASLTFEVKDRLPPTQR